MLRMLLVTCSSGKSLLENGNSFQAWEYIGEKEYEGDVLIEAPEEAVTKIGFCSYDIVRPELVKLIGD
jgi:hypothetical protein